ncbi:MAG: ATP-dependent helicase HrpB [Rhizobiaceae bacterium]
MSLTSHLPELPVSEVLDQIVDSLARRTNLVLVAPPGAGKTTLVPLAILAAADATSDWLAGRKIIVLEPRRLAARAAARRMAQLLGEEVGQTVGYRVRFDNRISAATRIEVVTEGVFSRMLVEDPGLEAVGAVVFDEFHERSLDGDLAVALCLDLQGALREDLRLLPMSATLETEAVATLLDAPVIQSQGRSFPVEIVSRERSPQMPVETAMAEAIRDEIAGPKTGSILAFLPGQREIERTAQLLEGRLPAAVDLHKLYGALPQAQQDAAIAPLPVGVRKVVLSSAIAETSLTIEGITSVIDSGLARQPVFEPATGLTRLQTVRASQASVTQRAGRAGRLGPGRAIRLWRAEQTAALPIRTLPEILNVDLAPLLLALADWGVSDPHQLSWLDAPPDPALAEARKLLQQLGALSPEGQLTSHGKVMSKLALPPRFAHMVLAAAQVSRTDAERAAQLALLVQERGVGGSSIDLDERLQRLCQARDKRSRKIMKLSTLLAGSRTKQAVTSSDGTGQSPAQSSGLLLAHGLPDRIAQRRGAGPAGTVRFRLANGRGAEIDASERLASEDFLVVVDMVGRAGAARILSAAAFPKQELVSEFDAQIETHIETTFDRQTGTLTATKSSKLGALSLNKPTPMKINADNALPALLSAVADHGLDILPWRSSDAELRQRLALLNHHMGPVGVQNSDSSGAQQVWPDVSDAVLLSRLDEWLAPFLAGAVSLAGLNDGSLSNGLMLLAGHPPAALMEQLVPSHFATPSGSRVRLAYKDNKVVLSVRPQELFGLDRHPAILDGRLPMEIELVSPAGRPIQITRDLPGFWRGSWRDVRADLRGRYPKHPWPEDPLTAQPTARAKPRKN